MTFVPNIYGKRGEPAPKRSDTTEDIARRVAVRNSRELTELLDTNADNRCPFYGWQAKNGSPSQQYVPPGCYALRESRCVLDNNAVPRTEYERCSAYQTALVVLGRARD